MMDTMENKCRSCKHCKVFWDPDYPVTEEWDCRLEMWDYFLEDIPCPRYVELIEEQKYPEWRER